MALSLADHDDVALIDAEQALHDQCLLRKSVELPVDDIVEAHRILAGEMASRGLMFRPMGKAAPIPPAKAKRVQAPSATPADPSAAADLDADDPNAAESDDPDADDNLKKALLTKSFEGHTWHLVKSTTGQPVVGLAGQPLYKRDYSVDERKAMAASGHAMPDGSFPVANEADLHNAIRLVGQGADPQAAMHHIIERAKAMGMEAVLPDNWKADAQAKPTGPQPGAHSMPGPAMPKQPGAGGGASGGGMSPGGLAKASDLEAGGGTGSRRVTKTRKFVAALVEGITKALDLTPGVLDLSVDMESDLDYAIVHKSADEDRYTLGPVYIPGRLDAHDEWATAEDMEKSCWDYVRDTGADRTVYLQHSERPAGEWVGVLTWPHPVNARMSKSIDGIAKAETVSFPAGTPWMGVVWEPWAWEDVKKGRITGFSMGGYAQRVEADLVSA